MKIFCPEPFSSEAPKVPEVERIVNLMRASGSSFALPCKGQGFPVPEFRFVSGWEMFSARSSLSHERCYCRVTLGNWGTPCRFDILYLTYILSLNIVKAQLYSRYHRKTHMSIKTYGVQSFD